jgi:uncharacterized protein (DUF2235 family)
MRRHLKIRRSTNYKKRFEQIQEELVELKRANSTSSETPLITSAKASGSRPASADIDQEMAGPSNPKSEPFAFADFTWLTGNARTKDTPCATKFFTPEVRRR